MRIPVYNPNFIDKVLEILNCLCAYCKNIIILNKSELDGILDKDRLQYLSKLSKKNNTNRKCQNDACQFFDQSGVQKIYKIVDKNIVDFSAFEALEFLKFSDLNLDKKLKEYFNFDFDFQLESMILSDIMIPPKSIRPTNKIGDKSIQHESTILLDDILKSNSKGFKIDKEIEFIINIQKKVNKYFENIQDRIEKKNGTLDLLRTNRGCNSARSVISGDPNIELNEVGVPLKIANKLSVAVMVSQFNIDLLKQLVLNNLFKDDEIEVYTDKPWQVGKGINSFIWKTGKVKSYYKGYFDIQLNIEFGSSLLKFVSDDLIRFKNQNKRKVKALFLESRDKKGLVKNVDLQYVTIKIPRKGKIYLF